jgi:hypothetical protein
MKKSFARRLKNYRKLLRRKMKLLRRKMKAIRIVQMLGTTHAGKKCETLLSSQMLHSG